jgi:hypothetical protein
MVLLQLCLTLKRAGWIFVSLILKLAVARDILASLLHYGKYLMINEVDTIEIRLRRADSP